MGRITDIVRQKRNKTRVSIFIDDEFVCGLDEVTALSARLKIGDDVDENELKKIVYESELNSAFERAVGYLSFSPRARKEIERYLTDKGYDTEVVAAALDRLVAYRYVDDRVYAESYVKSKSKRYGSFRLAAELKRKGIAQDVIDELLDDSGDNGITDVAKKYLSSHRTADKQKLKRFLAGRGFGWDSIADAVSALDRDGAFDTSDDGYDEQ